MQKQNINLPLSILQKLRNIAKNKGVDSENILYQYVIERFLYRLSISDYNDVFFLKGAFLFAVWDNQCSRTTRDIDFLGQFPDEANVLESIMRTVTSIPCEKDGLIFDLESIEIEPIREMHSYKGLRIKQNVYLGKAKVLLQIDVGFGDIITPKSEKNTFPSLLSMESPQINTYPIYTVIAEKLEAMVFLDMDNSRMKDFYDIWILIKKFVINQEKLKAAIVNTFNRRHTPLPTETPTALTESFYLDKLKNSQWNGFLKKNNLAEIPLKDIIIDLERFLQPILNFTREAASIL